MLDVAYLKSMGVTEADTMTKAKLLDCGEEKQCSLRIQVKDNSVSTHTLWLGLLTINSNQPINGCY